ncbi:hypothetical protein L0128_03120 [candidate division KSB1 bacterium]|nr:hypothetical protein [candidate division KSB1 bacterium]
MTTKKILFIGGSLNQTTMMHKISTYFPDYQCYFSPYYIGDYRDEIMKKFFDFTVLGGKYKKLTMEYFQENKVRVDEFGIRNNYNFVFTCQDLIVPTNVRHKKIFLVQEGMTDPESLRYFLVKKFNLPRWFAGTSATGLSDAYNLFFVASQGYKELFIQKGVKPEKLVVTGIPNFDNAKQYLDNDFPYHNYVLVATSNLRESWEYENRKQLIHKAVDIANGRLLIFKLHPSENVERATREINKYAPGALVFPTGNTNYMIANCDELVTRYSSVVYIALALGKKVHADLPLSFLKPLTPIQNNGNSARYIAEITRQYLERTATDYLLFDTQRGVRNEYFIGA